MLFGKAAQINQSEKEENVETEGDSRKMRTETEETMSKKMTEPVIRVLLTDSAQLSCYHSSVTVNQEGKECIYNAESPELQNGALILEGGDTGIAVPSIRRAQNPPVYYGTLEIRKMDKGLLLINELPLETYLEGVVPSEMPSSYEKEALMAQAVCARTYAICQIQEKSLKEEYDADVDDSVNYQVYGNFAADEKTSQAVQETKGLIMCQNGKPITAYYFSTSAGQTSTDEIWGADRAASYLKSVECDFDQNMPWSSWSVEIPWETLEERAGKLEGDGKLEGLQIVKKSTSGAVTGVELIKENCSVQINGEYEIREFFSPSGFLVTEKDGIRVKGSSLLPSAYFELKIEKGQTVRIQGKGYGHGVGMSQNGANEMAKKGYTWQEILNYFYRDITLESLNNWLGVDRTSVS